MNDFSPKPPTNLENVKRGPLPVCANWSDVTFEQWVAMHQTNKRRKQTKHDKVTRVHVDLDFPPRKGMDNPNLFNTGPAAGRKMSPQRAPMSYYRQIDEHLGHMKPFLNYIISWLDSVSEETVAVILRCLESRDLFGEFGGKAPVWSGHYTFDAGTW